MDLNPYVLFTLMALVWPFYAQASCETKKSADAVVECFLEKHPNLVISKAGIDVAEGEINVSSQRINPSLEWLVNESQQSNGVANEVNLKHTFELGYKRSARIKLAEIKKDLEVVDFEKSYNQLKIDLIMDLYRLRQIEHETEVIKENQTTFERMIDQYKKIGRMNPEQEISVNIFSMASDEVMLKLQKLKNERNQILTEFEVINQTPFTPVKNQLPPLNHAWPDLDESGVQGVLIKEADLKVEESTRNYALEKAKAWPDLALGPRMLSSPGPGGGTFFGAALSLNLPLLNLNAGGKQKASAGKVRAEMRKSLLSKRIYAEARRLKKVYQNSSRSYTQALKGSKIHKNHNRIHSLIKRGVVSPPLVIELHRQAIEFFEALHQQELAAVEARWVYYSLFSRLDKKTIAESKGKLK
jgi:cobalt-zinc-cadmium efflux system outer membrane protein